MDIRSKNFDRWILGYAKDRIYKTISRFSRKSHGTRHVIFALCDHYEPLWAGTNGKASFDVGMRRVDRWHSDYPKLADRFRDADGVSPQHSFFFPAEEYNARFFEALDDLVRRDYGEIELHLHHGDDTEETLTQAIRSALQLYGSHGHFTRSPNGQMRYAFIHGNWALANGRPDGCMCGVDSELRILYRTGCFADFTFPSCPDVTQPNVVNKIYWPIGNLSQKRSYETGRHARVGESFDDRLLMVSGPLMVGLRGDRLSPRIEYGAITAADPVTKHRVRHWVQADVHVAGRPEWIFVKVYTHGAQDIQTDSLLGEGGRQLHECLHRLTSETGCKLHYVTAREMYNIARAAMDEKSGNPHEYRDYLLPRPPIRTPGGSKSST